MARSKVHTYEFLVREAHLDTFGHVNNAEYLRLFEEARWEIITAGGYGMREIKERGVGPVLLEVNVKFKKELRLRQRVFIETELEEQNAKIYKIFQKMKNAETGDICAEAEYTAGIFDTAKRKLIDIPDTWRRAVGMHTP
ncbi:MAG TPA: acyl-CoA thioesterase [Bdellovibrionota bacterium]|nr:acyl-CoA thioesterase [Bdellovibrionota bacterium]